MLAAAFPGDPLIEENLDKFTEAAVYGKSPDPRFSFWVYSGKAYPIPGNVLCRIFNKGLWDINTRKSSQYRRLEPSHEPDTAETAFEGMLEVAIPDESERKMLHD